MSNHSRDGNAPRTVQTVETSYKLLDCLEERGEAGVTELASTLDISKSAIHRHLTTLVKHGRVENSGGTYRLITGQPEGVKPVFDIVESLKAMESATPAEIAASIGRHESAVQMYLDQLEQAEYVVERGDQYRNSLKFLDLGERVKYNTKIFDIVVDELDKLAAESGELALFSVMEHGQNVILYKSHGDDAIRTSHETGLREPLHCSGLGKSILAELSDDRVRSIVDEHGLESFTEQTITDIETLLSELQDIRERGFAFDMEEAKPGMRCVAAPVSSENSTHYGAVSIAAPKSRMQGDRLEREIPELVKGAANVIELNAIYVE